MKVCPKCGKQYPDDANFCPLDAGRLVAADESEQARPAEEAPPPVAPSSGDGSRALGGRFELDEPVGGGVTGRVYRATDQTNGTVCAVKLVDASVFPSSFLMQRTERELKQLVRLDSPGIARVHAHGKDGEVLWIASEFFADCRSLHDIVFDEGPMDLGRASQIMLKVGQALADAAKVGVIHRDLAPKNILVGPGDTIKIINFGVAVPTTEKVPGVPEYVAPEMVEGKPVDQRSNIYSLGAVFYYAITGQPPFMGEPEEVLEQHLSATPEPPSQRAELPEVVDGVVLKALERSSSKRFMTLRQFLSAVEHLAQGNLEGVAAATAQPLARTGKGKDKKGPLAQTMVGYGSKTGQETALIDDSSAEPSAGSTQKMGSAAMAGAAESASQPAAQASAPSAAQASASTQPATGLAGTTQIMGSLAVSQPGEPAARASHDMETERQPVQALMPQAVVSTPEPASQAMPQPSEPEPEPAVQPAMPEEAPAAVRPQPSPRPATQPSGERAGQRAEQDTDSAKKKARRGDKGKFRETMWFKKGELDSAAAVAADEEKKRTGHEAVDKADLLPLEDRYEDDGSLTSGDREKFSLKTGSTETMPAFREPGARKSSVSDRELIEEMKSGRGKIVALIVIGVVIVGAIVAFALMSQGHDDAPKKEPEKKILVPEGEPPAPAPAN